MRFLFDQSAITSNAPENKGFSFSFQADADADPSPQEELQYNTNSCHDEKENNVGADSLGDTQQIESSLTVADSKQNLPKLKQRSGLTFNTEELNVYTTKFVNANEGIDAILASMNNSKSAAPDQKNWEEERKMLTLDWKSKRKQALNQKKKRLQFRQLTNLHLQCGR